MECHPDDSDWLPASIGDRFLDMAGRLLQGIRERSMNQYFDTRVNLLEGKGEAELDAAATKLEEFLAFPEKYFANSDLQENKNAK